MKKLLQRLLIFILAVPLIVIIVLYLPQFNHLVLNVLTVIFTALGAAEFSVMLAQKKLGISRAEAAILGALPPAAMVLTVCFGFNFFLTLAVIAADVLWLLGSRVFSREETLHAFISRLAAGFAVLLYPGLLMTWMIGMSRWESAGVIILTFICTVFASDSTAWAAGMLFGKKNRGIIPASPNKSIAGFIGGVFGSIIIGTGAAILRPDIFAFQHDSIPGFIAGALLGLITGIAATLGDLAESALKRSSGLKDSGNIILGRGGVLDSVDSVAFAAPVFYLACRLFFALS